MWDSRGQNFRTNHGRQVALTGCSRSSGTRAQWTDVMTATDREVLPARKTLTTWRIWFWVKKTSSKLTAQSVKYHGRQAFLSHLLSASYERSCSWNTLRGDVRKSWLRRTALLVSLEATSEVFPVWRGLHLLYRWKGVRCGFSSERIAIVKIG